MISNLRPRVILNAAMTIDGRITTKGNDTNLSNDEDWRRVHLLRNEVDAIMVGRNTVIKDNPKLTVKSHLLPKNARIKHPIRVVVTSRLDVPLTAKLFTYKLEEAPTMVATTSLAPQERVRILVERGVEVVVCEDKQKKKVDLRKLLKMLWGKGIKSVLLEGGGQLNWYMLKCGLIDEIIIQVASKISGGGEGAVSLFEGEGFVRLEESPLLEVKELRKIGNNVLLHYLVSYRDSNTN